MNMPPTTTLPIIAAERKSRETFRAVATPTVQPRVPVLRQLPGTRTGWAMRAVYLASDLVAFLLSLATAKLSFDLVSRGGVAVASVEELKLYLLWAAGLVFVAAAQQTYAPTPPRPVRKFRGWVLGAFTVCTAIVAGAALLGVGAGAWYVTLVLATVIAVLAASFCRAVCRMLFGTANWWGTRLIVVGNGGLVARTYASLAREPQWGLRPVGFVDDGTLPDDTELDAYLGTTARLNELAEQFNVDWGLAAVHTFDAEEVAQLLGRNNSRIKHWIILPPLEKFPSLWLEACEAARRPAMHVTNRLRSTWSLPLKRALDLAVTIPLGVAVLPLVVLIVALIRLSSPGPIFYGQERIGRLGRRFKAWKFRTMLPNADAVLDRYLAEHPDLAAEWKANHKLRRDPRVTWVGRWLRSTSLDELPQAWNVIVGDMSLVGPRPIVSAEIDKYAENYEQYVQVMPGITGLWQVSGRNNTTYEERVSLDVYYVQNWSLWFDIYILACTAKVVLLCEGAY
jgi:Undecaprenyl-phosphate galactose phosphotransferase WbaP